MKLELLYITGCPNTEAARLLLSETLCELGCAAELSEVEVSDAAHAEALSFPGSGRRRILRAAQAPHYLRFGKSSDCG